MHKLNFAETYFLLFSVACFNMGPIFSLTVTTAQRLEQFTNDVNTQAHAKDERTMQALSNLVSNTISIKLEKTVKNEMKQTVLSGLEKMQAKHLENSSNLIAQVS